MKITEAFAAYGATRKYQYDSYSAIAKDGSVVVSLWQHLLVRPEGEKSGLRYEDFFSRWEIAERGKQEFKTNLRLALDNGLHLRLVVARILDPAERERAIAGESAFGFEKDYDPRKDLIGKVIVLTDDQHLMEFRKVALPAGGGSVPRD
jgi:hypothetical protein